MALFLIKAEKLAVKHLIKCRKRGRVVKGLVLSPTRSRFKTLSHHSVVSLGKTLYGTFPCLVVLASSSKLQSYLY